MVAEGAFQRDQRVAFDAAFGERQLRGETAFDIGDIGAGQAENRAGPAEFGLPSRGLERRARSLHDAGAGAVEVGHHIGCAAMAAPDDLARGRRQSSPALRAAAVDAQHPFHVIILRFLDNTNKIPISKTYFPREGP